MKHLLLVLAILLLSVPVMAQVTEQEKQETIAFLKGKWALENGVKYNFTASSVTIWTPDGEKYGTFKYRITWVDEVSIKLYIVELDQLNLMKLGNNQMFFGKKMGKRI